MGCLFVHTADWQLGKPFAGIAGDSGALLRRARFDAVRRIAEIASARGAAAVLVAGDCFDSPFPEEGTILKAADAMSPFGGPWVLLPGNHDPAEAGPLWDRLEHAARNLATAKLDLRIARKGEPIRIDDASLEILAAPLRHRHDPVDPTAWMATSERRPGLVRVGLAHGSVQGFGGDGESTFNRIDPRLPEMADLDYLALGDWHGTLGIGRRCWYSGTPEPDRFRSNEPGHVLVVEIDEPGALPRIERVPTAECRWIEETLEHSGDAGALIARVEAIVSGSTPADRLLLDLTLTGEIDIGGRARIEARIDEWRARLCHLRVHDGLIDRPSDEDLRELRLEGVAQAAASRLAAMAGNGEEEEDSEIARLALRRLYLMQHRIRETG